MGKLYYVTDSMKLSKTKEHGRLVSIRKRVCGHLAGDHGAIPPGSWEHVCKPTAITCLWAAQRYLPPSSRCTCSLSTVGQDHCWPWGGKVFLPSVELTHGVIYTALVLPDICYIALCLLLSFNQGWKHIALCHLPAHSPWQVLRVITVLFPLTPE